MTSDKVLPVADLHTILEAWRQAKRQDASKCKAKFTRLMNQWGTHFDHELIRETVFATVDLFCEIHPEEKWLTYFVRRRLSPGTLYEESGRRVFGWIDSSQLQAIPLPLTFDSYNGLRVSFYGFRNHVEAWIKRGFHLAEDLPVAKLGYPLPDGTFTTAWQVLRSLNNPEYPDLKFEPATNLPYRWDEEKQALEVTGRNLELGFWRAWKIWEGCLDWYRQRNPPGFQDPNDRHPQPWDVVLGSLKRQLEPQEFDAVLGGDRTS